MAVNYSKHIEAPNEYTDPNPFRQYIRYILGLDIGIGSCGWCIVAVDSFGYPFKIIRLDSLVFPNGEDSKGKSKTKVDRLVRDPRRTRRRSKNRRKIIKNLFIKYNLLSKYNVDHAFNQHHQPSIYYLRVYGLHHKLSNLNLFRVLYNFAKHRGFRSTRKYARSDKDNGALLGAIGHTEKTMKKYHCSTLGELLQKDPKFKDQKRNHDYNVAYSKRLNKKINKHLRVLKKISKSLYTAYKTDLSHTYLGGYLYMNTRHLIMDEATKILKNQAKSNAKITPRFISEYRERLYYQRPFEIGPSEPSNFAGNQVEKMIGVDTLDPTQPRAGKGTYTFEIFRMLTALNGLRYKKPTDKKWISLDSQQRKIVISLCKKLNKVTFKQIRKALHLDPAEKFNDVSYSAYRSKKLATAKADRKAESKTVFTSLAGIKKISALLPKGLRSDPDVIDKVGTILNNLTTNSVRIKAFHKHTGLSDKTIDKLLGLNFSGYGRLSIKTMRNLMPYLKQGYIYSDATAKAGYDFNHKKIDLHYIYKNVTNPVVKRAVKYTIRLVHAVIRYYGAPVSIHIELARNLADNKATRLRIQKSNLRHREINDGIASWLRDHGIRVNGINIITRKLYTEQHGIDPYTGNKMNPLDVFTSNFDIDHITPQSWTNDDSFTNKVLVSHKANEDKGARLPLQYLANNPVRKTYLIKFTKNVIGNYKKQTNLLRTGFTRKQMQDWTSRNINDTRYLNRLIANYLKQNIKFRPNANIGDDKVLSLNGSMTAKLRHMWDVIKIRIDGDKHHAMDAAVIACVTPALIKRVNTFNKIRDVRQNPKLYNRNYLNKIKKMDTKISKSKWFNSFVNSFPLPWHDFTRELKARLSSDPVRAMEHQQWDHYNLYDIAHLRPVHVIRKSSHKIRGAVTKDTLHSGKYLKQGYTGQRFNVSKLKLNKKGQIKSGFYTYIPKKNHSDQVVYDALLNHLKAHHGKGSDAFPKGYLKYRDPKGHPQIVRRVMLLKTSTSGVLLNGGRSIADNGNILRIDMFWNSKLKKYRYVPIYKADVIKPHLPDMIASSSKKAKHLTKDDHFKMTLYANDPVHVIFKRPRNIKWIAKDHDQIKALSDFWGYYWKPNANNGSICFRSFDNSFVIINAGMTPIKKITKYTISYLGVLHRVNERHRLSFKHRK